MKKCILLRLAPAGLSLLFVTALPAQSFLAIEEKFESPPQLAGWQSFGASGLFQWNPDQQWLEVTWDTDQPNSYFYKQLPTELNRRDDFSLELDLRLESISVDFTGFYGFQIAFGLIHLESALDSAFDRSTGMDSPNLAEFTYFPDTGFGATISPVIISSNNEFAVSFNFPYELDPGPWFQIKMSYAADEKILRTEMTRDGELFGPIKEVRLPETFTDFRLNAFAFSSYDDRSEDGRIVARASVDNLRVLTPPPPARELSGGWAGDRWEVSFESLPGWQYFLESTFDFRSWFDTGSAGQGTGGPLILADPEPAAPSAFYRIRAERLE
jgi:hypothetical protein